MWGFAWMEKKKKPTLFRSQTRRNGIKRSFKVQSPAKLPRQDQIYSHDQSQGVGCQPAAPDNLGGTSMKQGGAGSKGAEKESDWEPVAEQG